MPKRDRATVLVWPACAPILVDAGPGFRRCARSEGWMVPMSGGIRGVEGVPDFVD